MERVDRAGKAFEMSVRLSVIRLNYFPIECLKYLKRANECNWLL